MLHDITNNVRVLEEKIEHIMYCTEYVYGFRFELTVGPDGVKLEQDEEFNNENFGRILNLENIWEKLQENYGITEDTLKYGPLQYYTLRCIYYDDEFDGFVNYPGVRGVVVVEAQQLGSNNLIPMNRLNEFCGRIGMVGIKPVFEGNVSLFKSKYENLDTMLLFSKNGACRGFVIVPDPCVINPITLEFDRYFIKTSIEDFQKKLTFENPEGVAQEFVNYVVNLDLITDTEIKYALSPIRNRTKFLNKLVDILYKEYNDLFMDYLNRCKSNLPLDNTETSFKNIIKTYSKAKLTEIISNTETYKYQARS